MWVIQNNNNNKNKNDNHNKTHNLATHGVLRGHLTTSNPRCPCQYWKVFYQCKNSLQVQPLGDRAVAKLVSSWAHPMVFLHVKKKNKKGPLLAFATHTQHTDGYRWHLQSSCHVILHLAISAARCCFATVTCHLVNTPKRALQWKEYLSWRHGQEGQ